MTGELKFRKGILIEDIELLLDRLTMVRWVYFKDTLLHTSFVQHMTLAAVMEGIESKRFYAACEMSRRITTNTMSHEENK